LIRPSDSPPPALDIDGSPVARFTLVANQRERETLIEKLRMKELMFRSKSLHGGIQKAKVKYTSAFANAALPRFVFAGISRNYMYRKELCPLHLPQSIFLVCLNTKKHVPQLAIFNVNLLST